MDKKRLIGQEEPTITQHDIDAWKRGQGDGARNKLLAASRKLSPERAVALIKMYAELGDLHYVSTRFDINPSEVRSVLAAFGVNSIEDAKASVRNGVVAQFEDAVAEAREENENEGKAEHAAAQERLDEQQAAATIEEKTEAQIDEELAEARDTAQRKNKEDQLRQLISEGLDGKTNMRTFRIPLGRVAAFKRAIPNGISHLQRQFGGTAEDIRSEIERLAPGQYDKDMLRP